MTGCIFGAIADDFTGASDLAGLLARSGAAVNLRIGVPDGSPSNLRVDGTPSAPFEVIALKSRTAPVDEAVSDALAALEWLKAAGAQRFFWKYCSTFDSTAEGNIGPVAEALMKALGTKQTIYCPAFPENGRSIYMGNLFVGNQPLAESPMRNHPLTPMLDSNLMRLLKPQVTLPVGLVEHLTVAKGPDAIKAKLQQMADDQTSHVVVDAVADADLLAISTACKDMPLLTGGSAIAMHLPHLYDADGLFDLGQSEAQTFATDDKSIVLSGSCSAMTLAQVQAYINAGHPSFKVDPLDAAKTGAENVLHWLDQQDFTKAPLIYASADPDDVKQVQATLGVEQAGALVEGVLAKCGTKARDLGARQFIVAGGETSGAVTKALGINQLTIGREIAPGVPWTYCHSNDIPIALTLKSGNFGEISFFEDALESLKQA
ncbi:MAG: 3-oxo-tetronate kinase [Hyphomicrobiales bacterium]